MKLILCLIFSLLSKIRTITPDPFFGVNLSFALVNQLSNSVLHPALDSLLTNLSITGPFTVDKKIGLSNLKIIISDIKVDSFVIDWSKTNFIPSKNAEMLEINLENFNLNLHHKYYAHYLFFKWNGVSSIKIENLTLKIILKFEKISTGSKIKFTISDFDFKYKKIHVILKKKLKKNFKL